MCIRDRSERAAVLGDMDYAWALGEKALAATTPHGWDRAMSGDRLEAYGALLKVDAERARAMAYRDLTQSLTAEFNYPQNIARNLLVILPLISDQDLVLSVWEDVEKYLRQLLGDLSGFDEGPAFRDFRNDTSTSSICSLIVGCLNPVSYTHLDVYKRQAYVPDSATPLALRGESVSFLHDVVLALDLSLIHI